MTWEERTYLGALGLKTLHMGHPAVACSSEPYAWHIAATCPSGRTPGEEGTFSQTSEGAGVGG